MGMNERVNILGNSIIGKSFQHTAWELVARCKVGKIKMGFSSRFAMLLLIFCEDRNISFFGLQKVVCFNDVKQVGLSNL